MTTTTMTRARARGLPTPFDGATASKRRTNPLLFNRNRWMKADASRVASTSSERSNESSTSTSCSSSSLSPPSPPSLLTFRRHAALVTETLERTCGPRREDDATSLDDAFKTRVNARLGVTTTTEVWKSFRLRRVRATYVDGGDAAQIFNCAAYPAPSSPDAPVLGVDLISLGKGAARKVLIGVDLQPMCRDVGYAEAYVPKLEALFARGGALKGADATLGATKPSKKFYEDAKFFSQGMFFARPTCPDEDIMEISLEVVRAYLGVWLDRLDEAEREAEAMHGACKFGLALEDVRRCVLTEESARAGQDAHDAWQLEHDPAIPMFANWYGEEWAKRFAEEVLFPGPNATS